MGRRSRIAELCMEEHHMASNSHDTCRAAPVVPRQSHKPNGAAKRDAVRLTGAANPAAFTSIWTTWWLGDVGGQLLVAPAILLWPRPRPPPGINELKRSAPVYAAAILIGLIAFSPVVEQTAMRGPLAFLAIIPLLWAALLHGPRATATAALILYGFAVWGAAAGGGPFARPDLNASFLLLMTFGISTAVPSLVLSADAASRGRREEMLCTANQRFDMLIKMRTAALAEANRKLLRRSKAARAWRRSSWARNALPISGVGRGMSPAGA